MVCKLINYNLATNPIIIKRINNPKILIPLFLNFLFCICIHLSNRYLYSCKYLNVKQKSHNVVFEEVATKCRCLANILHLNNQISIQDVPMTWEGPYFWVNISIIHLVLLGNIHDFQWIAAIRTYQHPF